MGPQGEWESLERVGLVREVDQDLEVLLDRFFRTGGADHDVGPATT